MQKSGPIKIAPHPIISRGLLGTRGKYSSMCRPLPKGCFRPSDRNPCPVRPIYSDSICVYDMIYLLLTGSWLSPPTILVPAVLPTESQWSRALLLKVLCSEYSSNRTCVGGGPPLPRSHHTWPLHDIHFNYI